MPCRDYEYVNTPSNDREVVELKKQNDRLARIACKAMTALEKEGKEDFLLLKDDEVRKWWSAHKIADAKAAAEKAKKARASAIKASALSKLTDEERKILGIK